jgi:hypothetical protein
MRLLHITSWKEIAMDMRFYDRHADDGAPADSGPEGGDIGQIRTEAHRLMSEGADAIRKALSSNSQAFLHAVRQHGGQ